MMNKLVNYCMVIAYSYRKKSTVVHHMKNEFPMDAFIKIKITSVGGCLGIKFA